jgi:quercetin dioxygenase-like cupin family protein
MEIKRNGPQPSSKGPAEYFTGDVRIDPLFQAPDPARARGASVTFEPCARAAWHTHPLGQTLIVTSGCGLVQSWGVPIKIRPGDVIWCQPGEKHWHGATPTAAMTQSMLTAISIARAGGAVGRVGVPQDETMPASRPAFYNNVTVSGGPAPVRAYIEELLPDVLEGRIEPGRVFDRVIGLEEVPDGYRAMNEREAIKVLIEV